MLKALIQKLICPACHSNDSYLTAHEFKKGMSGHIEDGVLICETCSNWYPIENNLLELVPLDLIYSQDIQAFYLHYKNRIDDLGLTLNQLNPERKTPFSEELFSEQQKQREHFDWYAGNIQQDYHTYQNTPFWKATDTLTFDRWKSVIEPECWILDIGCADGRSSFPFTSKNNHLVGFDISKKMIRKAINRAILSGAHEKTTFFVSDAKNLPFRSESFDYVLSVGVLHHLPNPGSTFRDIYHIINKDGIFFGSENNKSSFRGLFDLFMKIKPLWHEEAGDEPLISKQMINKWSEGLQVSIKSFTSIFIPPHLLNLIGEKAALFTISITDRIFSYFPYLKDQGGLIVFEIHKTG